MVLDATLLNTQHDKVWIKGYWSNPGKGVVPFPIPWCCSYWKESLQIALEYSQPTYNLLTCKCTNMKKHMVYVGGFYLEAALLAYLNVLIF